MKKILASQEALEKQIDRFSAEILKLKDKENNAMLSFYSSKLATSRKRLKKVETTVMQIQDRVENIARMHEQLLAAEKKQEQEKNGACSTADAEEELKEQESPDDTKEKS
mmetsp:Transcript_6802/g.23895  ORF Transcript_6802/g.23895 Transcript_6802/m.23895 type:complete len:110 (-) Transcript_6802:856-1185(-)